MMLVLLAMERFSVDLARSRSQLSSDPITLHLPLGGVFWAG